MSSLPALRSFHARIFALFVLSTFLVGCNSEIVPEKYRPDNSHDAEYVLRVQPELLSGGIFKIVIKRIPSLEFPVANKDSRAIGSFFGDPREGRRREHHGVDIFARRHTPVLAPTEGIIRWSGERGLGGNVVWMRDTKRNQTLYFAHLETIYANRGNHVFAGDTLGTVGNSGNARTTPTHLHFGIYQSGPVDPFFFLASTDVNPSKIRGGRDVLGASMRTTKSSSLILDGPASSDSILLLERHQIMRVNGASARKYRVQLPGGQTGYIAYLDIERSNDPLRLEVLPGKHDLFINPDLDTPSIMNLSAGSKIFIHGSHNDFWYVSDGNGLNGWVSFP